MPYSLKIKGSALKELESLSAADRARVVAAIDGLKRSPLAGTLLKGQHTGLRRIRVGSFRIIYEVRNEELVILVLRVGHRREIYR